MYSFRLEIKILSSGQQCLWHSHVDVEHNNIRNLQTGGPFGPSSSFGENDLHGKWL